MKELIAEKIVKGVSVISAFVLVWLLASWADVVLHNVSNYSYASWNLFTMLF